jgi:hypothetical protein
LQLQNPKKIPIHPAFHELKNPKGRLNCYTSELIGDSCIYSLLRRQINPTPLPSPPSTTGNLNAIIASLSDLRPFAGDTVDWLIRVAQLIFEPLGTSSLFTFTTDTLELWLNKDMEPTLWRRVEAGEQLRATIYEFPSDNDALIMLSKITWPYGGCIL